jgi:hypothetical protein
MSFSIVILSISVSLLKSDQFFQKLQLLLLIEKKKEKRRQHIQLLLLNGWGKKMKIKKIKKKKKFRNCYLIYIIFSILFRNCYFPCTNSLKSVFFSFSFSLNLFLVEIIQGCVLISSTSF